jgi:hypothetical protein
MDSPEGQHSIEALDLVVERQAAQDRLGRRETAVDLVTEAEAAAIRTAFDQGGEFAAAVVLRRLFPGVADNAQARECARAIAAWKPLPVRPRQWTRRDPGRNRR